MSSMKRPASELHDLRPPKSSRSRNTSPGNSPAPLPPRLPPETPTKQGSASVSKSQSVSGLSSHRRSTTKTSETASQAEISYFLKSELNGAVWHDPNFFDKHPCPDNVLERILDNCPGLNSGRTQWTHPVPQGEEKNFYTPIIEILNAVGIAVHHVKPRNPVYIPFVDRSKRQLASDFTGMNTYPDIIRHERPQAQTLDKVHWHDLDMFVEVKKDVTLADEAIRQSARYARALFANRLDRRFIDTVAICGTTAIFLHFDRSGLIYSSDVDIYQQVQLFICALAGLLLRSDVDAGLNPIFTSFWSEPEEPNRTSQLSYRVTLRTGVYDVSDVIYYRLAVRSRATLTLGLQQHGPPNNHDEPVHVVLKLTWRDQTRFREGLILAQFSEAYGVCPVVYEEEANIGGEPDVVYSRTGLSPGPRAGVFGRRKQAIDIAGAQQDHSRVQSLVVIQPGRPLRDAVDAFELAAGMVGALMGHWALVTNQVQHRDISANNILLTHGVYKYKKPEWVRLQEIGVEQCAQEFTLPEWGKLFNQPNMPTYKTVKELKWKFNPRRRLDFLTRTIRVLGRPEPFGFLSDLDMANILTLIRENVSDMHTHRTGTPAFMAVELLLAKPTKPVPHTYVHDLESFFWVLLYIVAEHREGGAPVNSDALEVLERLDRLDNKLLGDGKIALLVAIVHGTLDVRSFGTVWAESLAPVVEGFAKWVNNAMMPTFDSTSDPDACFETILSYFLDVMPDLQASRNHPLG